MHNPFSLNLDSQLDSDEKLQLFLRPSRLAYLLHYVLHSVLMIVALAILVYGFLGTGFLHGFSRMLGWLLLLLSLFLFVRTEYRIWSRMYGITTERLLYSRGILSQHFESANYQYLTEVSMDQTFWDKIVDCGNLFINTAGNARYQFRYRKVRRPVEIKKMINDLQDLDRQKKGPHQESKHHEKHKGAIRPSPAKPF